MGFKDFIKPSWGKIIITILFLLLISGTLYYGRQQSNAYWASQVDEFGDAPKVGAPPIPYLQINLIVLIPAYILASLIVFVWRKIRTK